MYPLEFSLGGALSEIFASISLTASLCLLLPQLLRNYERQSADGLSLLFLMIWLIGDVSSLIGAISASIAPSAAILAGYLCCSDSLLIIQCIYYSAIRRRKCAVQTKFCDSESSVENTERDLLLPKTNRAAAYQPLSDVESADCIKVNRERSSLFNTVFISSVYAVGTAIWLVQYLAGSSLPKDRPTISRGSENATQDVGNGVLLGYVSALCYIFARIPQIVKNSKDQSTEGLAPLFFLLSMTGNFTYGMSVLTFSQKSEYLVKAVPWLLGSLGTVFEDGIIFLQFKLYARGTQDRIRNAF